MTLQKEIDALFKSLCHKLDALSNFHYTPKAPAVDIEVVKNVPAITMEEILPMAVNDRVMKAPEEIFNKKHGRFVCLRLRHPTAPADCCVALSDLPCAVPCVRVCVSCDMRFVFVGWLVGCLLQRGGVGRSHRAGARRQAAGPSCQKGCSAEGSCR